MTALEMIHASLLRDPVEWWRIPELGKDVRVISSLSGTEFLFDSAPTRRYVMTDDSAPVIARHDGGDPGDEQE